MGLWVRAHATVKNMGSMGDSDAEKGGLLSLTYASPPEWDCPPGTKEAFINTWGGGTGKFGGVKKVSNSHRRESNKFQTLKRGVKKV